MKRYRILLLCLSWLVAFALGNGVLAQDKQVLTQSKVPLEQLLNRDGTLNLESGFNGSLDPAGWQMMTGPNGEPRFVPFSAEQKIATDEQLMAVPGDENWDDRFGSLGPHGPVYAIAVSGSEVYAGGYFTTAAGVLANHISKWDGYNWSALGSGMNNIVHAIAISDGEVYAGGEFTIAGGVPANYIAKWDGTSWSALGSGMNNSVRAIAISDGEVYAGGNFTTAGEVAAKGIAKWDGTSWSGLGNGINGRVLAVTISGRDVYVGGVFTTAGEVTANNVAKWNGSNWAALGSGVSGTNRTVSAIAVSSSEVYVGGSFTTAGEVRVTNIAKWDGTSWSALGNGLSGFSYSGVDAMAISGSELYVVGDFIGPGGGVWNAYIAKWDGTRWLAVGSGLNAIAEAIAINGSEVYAGGGFTTAGGVEARYIAKWDGMNWSGLNAVNQNGINGSVSALAVNGSAVYAGGYFTTAGGILAKGIAKWDDINWSTLGDGVKTSNQVRAIAANGNDLYVGGGFYYAGDVAAKVIAKWDGSSWSAMGSGMNSSVFAIAVSSSEVYAGGYFTNAGGVAANYIAKWDGTSWSALGTGMNGIVRTIAISGSNVYAGGDFTTAGGVEARCIAKWDGTSWSALGNGVVASHNYGRVNVIVINSNDLYVGGSFTTAGGVLVNHIAKWDGMNWSALGSGVVPSYSYGGVNAIAINGSDVYVGGSFTTAGGVLVNHIAKWDGMNWSVLGSGLVPSYSQGGVDAIAISGSYLYVGGNFSIAGGKPSSNFGRYSLNAPPTVAAGGPYNLNEGASVTVTASGSDPENGPLIYAWDLDNNGSFESPGQTVIFFAADIDGPASRTIQVQVTDNGGLTAIDQATVNVVNVAPIATFIGTPDTIIVGQSANLAFSNQFDPSVADVAAGFNYSYDATNDGTFEISDVAATSYTCPYPVSGAFTAKGRIKDKDGGFTDYTVQIVVQTPKEATASLIDQVQALVDADILNEGQGNALISKLEAAIKQLDKGNITPAINELQAFINQVTAFMNSDPPILTPAEGQPLIDAATAIIAALNNPQLAKAGFQAEASEGLTAVDPTNGSLPTGFQLEQNSPNPFNPVTTIQFAVPQESYVRLKVYNSFGAEVATLVDQLVAAGTYKVTWDASHLATGFYFSRLEAEGFAQTRKLLLMK